MGYILGKDCKVFNNSGTWASPTWDEFTNVEVAGSSIEAAEAEFKNRGLQFSQSAGGILTASIDLTLTHFAGTDADYELLRDAIVVDPKTLLDMFIADGPSATSKTQGLRGYFTVLNMGRDEPLEDGVKNTFTIKPGVPVIVTELIEWHKIT